MKDEEINANDSDPVVTDFSVALDEILKRRGTASAKKLAATIGISKGYVSSLRSGARDGGELKRREIARECGYSLDEFLSLGAWLRSGGKFEGWRYGKITIKTPSPIHPREQAAYDAMVRKNEAAARKKTPGMKYSIQPTGSALHRVPVISWVQAGDWTDVFDPYQPGYAEEWIETTATTHENAFALVVRGDSMEPEFVDGDVVVVDPGLDVHSGDYVIAKNGDEATFKQLVMDGSGIFLKPMNNRYPIKEITGGEMRIVGVVVAKEKRYR